MLSAVDQMSRLRAGQMELALQITRSDVDVPHGHPRIGVAEQFHERGKGYAGANHLAGVGVSKLVWNDAGGYPGRSGRLRAGSSGADGSRLACHWDGTAGDRREARDRKSGRSVGVGRVHKQTSLPGPSVPSSTCRAEREWPSDPEPTLRRQSQERSTHSPMRIPVWRSSRKTLAGRSLRRSNSCWIS